MAIKIKIPARLTSRKFWLAIASALIVFCNKGLDWGLDEKEILAAIGSLLSFVWIEGYADAKRAEGQ